MLLIEKNDKPEISIYPLQYLFALKLLHIIEKHQDR